MNNSVNIKKFRSAPHAEGMIKLFTIAESKPEIFK